MMMKTDISNEEYKTEEALISILKNENNVVVTTKCNLDCIFCSRKFNPFTTEYFHYDFNFIKSQVSMFKPNNLITVNASISRLTDGEPFTHPKIWSILELIRKKFPYTNQHGLQNKIRITTNGSYLTDKALKKLENLKGIIIAHSLKSMNAEECKRLTGASDRLVNIMQTLPERIQKFNITYVPTIVVLPEIMGWDGIENMIKELYNTGIGRLKINLPTYTRYASKEEQDLLKCDQEKLYRVVDELRKKLKMSMVVLPIKFDNITPNLNNFEYLRIMPEDEIITIDRQKIFSRWHAQRMLTRPNRRAHIVKLKRNGVLKSKIVYSKTIKIETLNDYWLNEDITFLPKHVVGVVGDRVRVLVLMSEAGSLVVKRAFEKAAEWEPVLREKEFFFRTVKSRFYRGSVVCAGLLVCSDYRSAIQEFLDSGGVRPDLILVSQKSFDPLGRDLLKESIYDLSDEFNISIKTL